MVNSLVERATNDLLIGPDWAMNIEICDILNRDLTQAKDVVRGLKKRIRSRNPKAQLLALTLLETVIKNCGDIVHMHVAEKGVLNEMVKIVKKKNPDPRVKEKVLTLVDTWQEAFGGARARYPQYYAAYQELLRAGAVFPERSERSAPIFTPPQTEPLTSYPQNLRNSEEATGSPAAPEVLTMSLTELQNARGIMDVLAEMLNALDPGNKEGLRQEVIIDLVEQCKAYKQRVVHLVNTTSDEELLSQGLALNDDLQRLLAKHEAISSGTSILMEKPKPPEALVDVGDLVNINQPEERSRSSVSSEAQPPVQLLLPGPSSNGPVTPSMKADPRMDLLSGENYDSPGAENSLALVSVGVPEPANAMSQQNALVLSDFYSQTNNTTESLGSQSAYSAEQTSLSTPQFQQQQQPLQPPQLMYYSNGTAPNNVLPQNGQSSFTHGNHLNNGSFTSSDQSSFPSSHVFNHEQQQQQHYVHGGDAQGSGTLPPPPWEALPVDNNHQAGTHHPQQMHPQPMQGPQVTGTQYMQPMQVPQVTGAQYMQPMQVPQVMGTQYMQPMQVPQAMGTQPQQYQMVGMYGQQMTMPMHHQASQGGQMMGMLPQQMNGGQFASMHPQQMPGNQMAGYMYGQRPDTQFLEQRMNGLTVQDDRSFRNNSYQMPTHRPAGMQSRTEDKLFGDLVDISKFKPKTG